MRGDTLVATGEASTPWVREASLLSRTLPGVRATRPVGHPERGAARRQPAAGSGDGAVCPRHARSGAGPGRGARRDGRRAAAARRRRAPGEACAFASSSPATPTPTAPSDRNLTLSRERAAAVVAALPRAGVAGARVRVARRRQRRAAVIGHHRGRQTAEPARRRPHPSARRQLPSHDSEEDLHARFVLGGQDQPGRPLRQQCVLRQVPHHGGRQDRQEGADGRRHRRDPDAVGHLRRRRLPEAADVLPARRRRLPAGGRRHPPRHARHRPAGAADRARAGGGDAVHPVPQQGRPARPMGDRSRPGRRARPRGRLGGHRDQRQARRRRRRGVHPARPRACCRKARPNPPWPRLRCQICSPPWTSS